MAVSIDSINAIPDYSDEHQLKCWKKASIDVALAGVSYAVEGRSLTRNNADMIASMIRFFEQRIADAAAAESGGGNVLVQYGERV